MLFTLIVLIVAIAGVIGAPAGTGKGLKCQPSAKEGKLYLVYGKKASSSLRNHNLTLGFSKSDHVLRNGTSTEMKFYECTSPTDQYKTDLGMLGKAGQLRSVAEPGKCMTLMTTVPNTKDASRNGDTRFYLKPCSQRNGKTLRQQWIGVSTQGQVRYIGRKSDTILDYFFIGWKMVFGTVTNDEEDRTNTNMFLR